MRKFAVLYVAVAVWTACGRAGGSSMPAAGATDLPAVQHGEPAALREPGQPLPSLAATTAAADVAAPTAEATASTAPAPAQASTPTSALPPEGSLLGLRDGPRWLGAVGTWLRKTDPDMAVAQSGAVVGSAAAPAQWRIQANSAAVLWPAAGLAWHFGAQGCAVFAATAAPAGQGGKCAPTDEGAATVQLAVLALARADVAANLIIETLDVHGTGVDAVVAATLALPAWRARWQLRAHADGRLLAVAWPRAGVELASQSGTWRVSQHGQALFEVRFLKAAPDTPGAVLEVPYDGRGDPDEAIASAARSADLIPLGPVAVVLEWQPPKLRIVSARRAVLAAPRGLAQGAVLQAQPAAPLFTQPIVLSRQNAAQALRDAPAGCIEAVLLGDATTDRGEAIAGASLALVRRCHLAAAKPPDPAGPDRP